MALTYFFQKNRRPPSSLSTDKKMFVALISTAKSFMKITSLFDSLSLVFVEEEGVTRPGGMLCISAFSLYLFLQCYTLCSTMYIQEIHIFYKNHIVKAWCLGNGVPFINGCALYIFFAIHLICSIFSTVYINIFYDYFYSTCEHTLHQKCILFVSLYYIIFLW